MARYAQSGIPERIAQLQTLEELEAFRDRIRDVTHGGVCGGKNAVGGTECRKRSRRAITRDLGIRAGEIAEQQVGSVKQFLAGLRAGPGELPSPNWIAVALVAGAALYAIYG